MLTLEYSDQLVILPCLYGNCIRPAFVRIPSGSPTLGSIFVMATNNHFGRRWYCDRFNDAGRDRRLGAFSARIPGIMTGPRRVFEEMNRALEKNEVTPLCFQSQNPQLFKISRRLVIQENTRSTARAYLA
jgi:hypothetical protein